MWGTLAHRASMNMLSSYGLGDAVVIRYRKGSNPLLSSRLLGSSQVVRHETLILGTVGSNPTSPASNLIFDSMEKIRE